MTRSNNYKISLAVFAATFVVMLVPVFASAQGVEVDLQSLLADFMNMMNNVTLPILIAVEIIVFVVGVIRYVMNPDKKEQASRFLMFSIAAIFATVALLGIVFAIQQTLGVGSGGTIQPPQLQFSYAQQVVPDA
jgi:hypothetical protein